MAAKKAEAPAKPKTPREDPRDKARKLVASAIGEKTEAARRSMAWAAVKLISEHDLLTLPAIPIDPIKMVAQARGAAERIREVAADPAVQTFVGDVGRAAGALSDLFGNAKNLANAARGR